MQREIEAVLTGSFVKVQAARDEMQWGDEGPPPLLVKIAPDLSKQDLEDIAAVLKNALFFFFFFQSHAHIWHSYGSFIGFVGCSCSPCGWIGNYFHHNLFHSEI